MFDCLADKLQIWGFEENIVIFSDGSLGFALKAKGIDITALSNEAIVNLSEKVSVFLNGLPEETDIQFLFSITGNNDSIFSEFEAFTYLSENQISRKLATERLAHLKNDSAQGILPKYELLILVRKDFSKNIFKKEKIL